MLPFYEIRKTDLTVKRNTYEVDFPEHFHKYIEIIYVYSGTQHIKIENISYEVNEGEAAIIFPDLMHSYYKYDKKTADALLIMCEPKILGSLFPDYTKSKPINPILKNEQINKDALYALNNIKPSDSFEIKFGWICIILSHVINALILNSENRAPIQDITYKIIKYIDDNFTQNITRDLIANTFNINKYYISKIFSQGFKMNLRKYLGLIRAEYAANLIRTTDQTFTSICRDSGFESIRTFNRVFKEIYSITPAEYRRNIKKYTNKNTKKSNN